MSEIKEVVCDGILMAYSPYEDDSLTELSATLSEIASSGISLPPTFLVRTRSDLKDAMIISNDKSNNFIKKYCSFSSAELLFYGENTPFAFYVQMSLVLLKAHGYYAPSHFRRYLQISSQKILHLCSEKV